MHVPFHYSFFDHLTFQIQETLVHDDLQATVQHAKNLRIMTVALAVFTLIGIGVCSALMVGAFTATYGLSSILMVPITVLAIGLYDTYRVFRVFHNYVWCAYQHQQENNQVNPEANDIYKWVAGNKPQWYHDMKGHVDAAVVLPMLLYWPLGKMHRSPLPT